MPGGWTRVGVIQKRQATGVRSDSDSRAGDGVCGAGVCGNVSAYRPEWEAFGNDCFHKQQQEQHDSIC